VEQFVSLSVEQFLAFTVEQQRFPEQQQSILFQHLCSWQFLEWRRLTWRVILFRVSSSFY
jgi:hypothetical protein